MPYKKISAVSALAAVALASCSQAPSVAPGNAPTASDASSAPAPAASGTSAVAEAASMPTPSATGVAGPLPTSVREVEFSQPYSVGPNQGMLKGKIVLENGIVKSVEIPNAQGPQAVFAAGVGEKAYGKPVKGLQIESVSGASLTTAAFNEFLKTVE